jgi:hypothetical protein
VLALAVAAGTRPLVAVGGVTVATGSLAFAAALGRTLLHLLPGPDRRPAPAPIRAEPR